MTLSYTISLLGRPVRISVYDTGGGVNVLIEGGDRGHIGAAALAAPGCETAVTELPGHREGIVAKGWAEALSNRLGVPVSVEAGIHFDGITRPEIAAVLAELDRERERVLSALRRQGTGD